MENTITLSVEQFEALKKQIKKELQEERKGKWNAELAKVQRKYHEELVHINHGSTWNAIRSITAYLMGYKLVREIPNEKAEEAAQIAEELCQKIIAKHKENEHGRN